MKRPLVPQLPPDPRDENNPAYEDPLNPGLIIRDYCSCEGEDHDYDCELDPDNY